MLIEAEIFEFKDRRFSDPKKVEHFDFSNIKTEFDDATVM